MLKKADWIGIADSRVVKAGSKISRIGLIITVIGALVTAKGSRWMTSKEFCELIDEVSKEESK